jgi:phage tail protein X
VIQINAADRAAVEQILADHGLADCSHLLGHAQPNKAASGSLPSAAISTSTPQWPAKAISASVTNRPAAVEQILADHGLADCSHLLGHAQPGDRFVIRSGVITQALHLPGGFCPPGAQRSPAFAVNRAVARTNQ